MGTSSVIAQLCKLAHATSLQQMCDMICDILGNPVFVNDMAHTTLAYTKTVEIEDVSWQTQVVQSKLERSVMSQTREVGAIHEASVEARMPILVTDGAVPVPRIIKALSVEGQVVGVMVVPAYFRSFRPEDMELVELMSAFVAAQVVKERGGHTGGNHSLENYLFNLLEGERVTREQVKKRLDVLGYVSYPNNYVLCICLEKQENGEDEELEPILEEFRRIPHCCTFLFNSTLVCLCDSDTEITHWEDQKPLLTELLRQRRMIAGVSRRFDGIEHLKEHYHQAQDALTMGCRLGRQNRYHTYDGLSSFLMFQRLSGAELQQLCHQDIQKLDEYDREHNTELCATLQIYLEQTKSLARTADILFIHRNTVRYRINKCMEILGTTLEDGNEIFSYILSLRVLEYGHKCLRSEQTAK